MAQLPVGEAGLSGLLRGLHPCQAETFRAPLIERASCGYAHPRLSYQDCLPPASQPLGASRCRIQWGIPHLLPLHVWLRLAANSHRPPVGLPLRAPGFCSLLPVFSPRKSFPWLSGLFRWLLPTLGACPLSATSPTSSLRGSPSATDGQLHGRGTRAEPPSVQGPAAVLSKC